VQSIRARASFGFDMIRELIIANTLNYPFMEFRPQYVSAIGDSLIEGYRKIEEWVMGLFLFISAATIFIIQTAVTMVITGIVTSVFGIPFNNVRITGIIVIVITLVLGIGPYVVLDKVIKIVIIALTVTTIIAVLFALNPGFHNTIVATNPFHWSNSLDLLFLITFVGRMPSPIYVSVWQSLLSVAKVVQPGFKPTLGDLKKINPIFPMDLFLKSLLSG